MKYKKLLLVVLSILLVVLIIVGHYAMIHERKEKQEMDKPIYQKVNMNGFIEPWYQKYRVITHALGGINGKSYTNSIDALNVNYESGKRLYEADFNYTSDGVVILTHDFQETENNLIDFPDGYVPSYEEFMSNHIYYKYHPTSALELLEYMHQHGDMYLVSDIKYEDPATITSIMQDIVNLAIENDMEEVLDRFIVQFYFEQNYYDLQAIYPFKNYIYSLYAEKNKDFERAKDFCLQNNIPVVLMRSSWVKDETTLSVFNDNNIKVYVYTLNNLTTIYERLAQGVYGIVSDYTFEKDLFIKDYYSLPIIYRLPIDIDFNKLYD